MTTVLQDAPATDVLRPNIVEFFTDQGRLPRLGDIIPPWEYRGWLLWYCQLAHQHPGVGDRWGYYSRTLEAGCLLQEPIPQLSFMSQPDNDASKMLRKALDLIYVEVGSWSAFPALIDWFAWGLAVSNDSPRFSTKLNESLYRHVDLGPLLLAPYDYLGNLYSEGKTRWNPSAFFPTPHSVVELMIRMTMIDVFDAIKAGQKLPDGRDPRTVSVLDPAVGSGRMLLHASNISLCLYGVDIDRICCRICAINGALYAPWMTFPFPQAITGVELGEAAAEEFPIPTQYTSPDAKQKFRVDDRSQGLLFPFDIERKEDDAHESALASASNLVPPGRRGNQSVSLRGSSARKRQRGQDLRGGAPLFTVLPGG